MKPPDWVIEDIRSLRQIDSKSPAQTAYLSLLLWFTNQMKEWRNK